AKIINPTVLGNPIKRDIKKENFIFLFVLLKFPLAFAADTLGISTLENAPLNDKGNAIKVSTFPLNIPYCNFASVSVIKLFSSLTIVIESMFLLIPPKIGAIDIGI